MALFLVNNFHIEVGNKIFVTSLFFFSWLLQALRTILQLGVKPSWFNTWSTTTDDANHQVPGTPTAGDLRNHMIESPRIGDSVVPEMLLKVLEPYRREGIFLCNIILCYIIYQHLLLNFA